MNFGKPNYGRLFLKSNFPRIPKNRRHSSHLVNSPTYIGKDRVTTTNVWQDKITNVYQCITFNLSTDIGENELKKLQSKFTNITNISSSSPHMLKVVQGKVIIEDVWSQQNNQSIEEFECRSEIYEDMPSWGRLEMSGILKLISNIMTSLFHVLFYWSDHGV